MGNYFPPATWRAFWRLGIFLFVVFLVVAGNVTVLAGNDRGEDAYFASDDGDAPLCRFGVNVTDTGDVGAVDLASLRVGWYMNFTAIADPPRPGGIEYMPVVRIERSNSTKGYTYRPAGSQLLDVIATNPGAKWMISNEPDSIWQDNLTPGVYARAYHELYYLIKAADPAAQIIAGSIVQATEIRLLYLDMVLHSYHAQFGEPFPVDGWSIHNYILNEVIKDHETLPWWGADIPPGIDRLVGEVWGLKDIDRVDVFIDRIVRFRQWLLHHGYGGHPLYLTEYGILFPATYEDENGEDFGPSRVNAFMDETYQYMLGATDPRYGNPNDGHRLVQQWSWFSIGYPTYNGDLFDLVTKERTAIGDFYASFTASIDGEVDLYPRDIGAAPPAPISQGESVTLTLRATVANSGNLVAPTTATVRFYDAHPDEGGLQIGSDQVVSLAGCGENQEVSVLWTDVPPGAHDAYVQVTSPVNETATDNNVSSGRVLVGTNRLFLPGVRRTLPAPGE